MKIILLIKVENLLNFTARGLTALALSGTGGSLSPACDADTTYYTFDGVTADVVKITATGVGQTIKLFVDNAYIGNLTSGSAYDLSMDEAGSKKAVIMANETNKAPKIYEIVIVKTA